VPPRGNTSSWTLRRGHGGRTRFGSHSRLSNRSVQGARWQRGYGKVRGRCHVTAWLTAAAAMIQNAWAAPQTTTACTVHGSTGARLAPHPAQTPLVPTPFHLTSLHPGLHPESSRARGALLQHSRRPSPSWATQSLGTRAPCAHAGGAPSAFHTTVRAAPIPCPPTPGGLPNNQDQCGLGAKLASGFAGCGSQQEDVTHGPWTAASQCAPE
jgi:hypothetical protein